MTAAAANSRPREVVGRNFVCGDLARLSGFAAMLPRPAQPSVRKGFSAHHHNIENYIVNNIHPRYDQGRDRQSDEPRAKSPRIASGENANDEGSTGLRIR
jgi:hypothetical protein